MAGIIINISRFCGRLGRLRELCSRWRKDCGVKEGNKGLCERGVIVDQ